ncbi:MAG: S-adenosylmethionine:tRNA ribosyltransferase-isomerase, partial [bacterium]
LKEATLNEKNLRERYQSIFARDGHSVAAPTASLHFTPRVLKKIEKKGIRHAFVTLNVGMGTFATLTEDNFKTNKLHTEWCEISKQTAGSINKAKEKDFQIMAVGTTATRTLEAALIKKNGSYVLEAKSGNTDIFIYPPHHFKLVDIMLTNFHLPKSSLMLLVDAFLKDKEAQGDLLDLYRVAIKEKFRFYSFGDAMLIL